MDRGAFLTLAAAFAAAPARASRDRWIPMRVAMNRCFAPIAVTAHGEARSGMFWLDTGGGKVVLQRDFAKELGLRRTGASVTERISKFTPVESPTMSIAGVEIPLASDDVVVAEDDAFLPGVEAQGLLPVRLLRDHAVTFDYPRRRFALDVASIPGQSVAVSVDKATGFVSIPVIMNVDECELLLDTGASCTMVSQALLDHWRAQFPEWTFVHGAFGDANMLGGALEASAEMVRVPNVAIGPASRGDVVPQVALGNLVAVSRPVGTFERWLNALTSGAVVGSLAGNALSRCCLTIDYPNARAYFDVGEDAEPNRWDLVPLALTPANDGAYAVSDVLRSPQFAHARDALIGAALVSVDGVAVTHRSLGAVHALLRGVVGTNKRVVVRRNGARHAYDLPVVALWSHDD